jgi:hypothetical protein
MSASFGLVIIFLLLVEELAIPDHKAPGYGVVW